jgi:hypothetical protein
MSALLHLVDGRTVAVTEDVSEVTELVKAADKRGHGWHEFRLSDHTHEVRRIRLSAIVEYQRGHSK